MLSCGGKNNKMVYGMSLHDENATFESTNGKGGKEKKSVKSAKNKGNTILYTSRQHSLHETKHCRIVRIVSALLDNILADGTSLYCTFLVLRRAI